MDRKDNFEEYLIILHENQMSIKHLTQNVEKLSRHLDKMVEKQVEMLVQHKELNVVKEVLESSNERIEKLEKAQAWTAKTLAGAVLSFIVSVLVFVAKGGA